MRRVKRLLAILLSAMICIQLIPGISIYANDDIVQEEQSEEETYPYEPEEKDCIRIVDDSENQLLRKDVIPCEIDGSVNIQNLKIGEAEDLAPKYVFRDVTDSNKYFYSPVYWAYGEGITTGTTSTTFSPNDPCTREQIVTFLWRYAGEPEPKKIAKFSDMKKDAYYVKALSWAVENGITTGLNDGTNRFGVGMPCTREMCVTFLWRFAGEPYSDMYDWYIFNDVNMDKYYTDPVSWAYEKKVTTGLNDGTNRFGVGLTCSRAMIVTFLYRFNEIYSPSLKAVTGYSYEIIPLTEPFGDMFYIKTDNPDPQSFRFIDKDSKYIDQNNEKNVGTISVVTGKYADVKYEDETKYRVKGGYIASSDGRTDGGELILQARTPSNSNGYYTVLNYMDTSVKVTVSALVDVVDYLIQKYGDSSKDFFENMSAINAGFDSECLYSGASVRGKLVKSTNYPYYGISTSPHVDQDFYIQDPYYREGGESLLVSDLYPMRYDSAGFPRVMYSIAVQLDPSVEAAWNSNVHWLIDFTLNGRTESYGGAGNGGGQSIDKSQIKYFFSFDGSANDAIKNISLSKTKDMLNYYGSLTVPDDTPEEGRIRWPDVRKTVGDGSYVKVVLLTSIWSGGADQYGYSYMYDNGSTSEGDWSWGDIGYFDNAWYDGRYFNRYEFFEEGTKFGEPSKMDGTDTSKATIIVKDAVIEFPQGEEYAYEVIDYQGQGWYTTRYGNISEVDDYNMDTHVWSGYTYFYYDSESGNWIADKYYNAHCYQEGEGWSYIEDEAFKDACTLTKEEVLAMGVDKNANVKPKEFYIYDELTPPGTKGEN